MPGISMPCGLGTTARSVTAPVPRSTVTPLTCKVPGRAYALPSSSTTRIWRLPWPFGPSPSSWRRSCRISALLWTMSTCMGSSCCTVVSACVWLAVTSAPAVTVETSMRPEIGAAMRVRSSCTRAASSAARATATSAWAWRKALALSSALWRLSASALSNSASRSARVRATATWASAFCSAAAARARSAS